MAGSEQLEKRTTPLNQLAEDWSWLPDAGQPTIASEGFQLLYGIYFGALTWAFMQSAEVARGGLHGVSLPLVVMSIVLGFFSCRYLSRIDSKHQRVFLGAPVLSLAFLFVLALGLVSPLGFNYGPGTVRPPFFGAGIYAVIAGLIFARLAHRVSPEPHHKGEYPTELFQAHFDNNWRVFQAYLSIAIAAFVGVFFPIGTVMVKRQNLIPGPLVWFSVGLLTSLVVLVFQLQAESRLVEKAYKQDTEARTRS